MTDPTSVHLGFGGPPAAPGTVHLVGSGPGDPGLLTLRAATLLATCDVVAYDRLAPEAVLALVPESAERICVGKRAGEAGTPRAAVDDLLRSRALAGRAVVRLKGGDPFVFGRGGEEAQACVAAGVPVEVVAGVTSAVAVAGSAGIPVTHRHVSAGFAVATAHEDPTKPEGQVDLAAMAAFPGTLVFMMGVDRLGEVVRRLTGHGREPATPVAVVQWGTTGSQRTVDGTLADIEAGVADAGLGSPAVIVVGEVVRLRHGIPARDRRELHGVRVLLPRLGSARSRPSTVAARLRLAGAEVVEVELARTVPGDLGPVAHDARAGRLDALVLTSDGAVGALVDALGAADGDVRDLAGVTLVTTGPRAVRELRARGLRADVVAASPAGLAAEAPARLGRTVVLASEGAEVGMTAALEDAGAEVEVVTAVRIEPRAPGDGEHVAAAPAQVVVLPAAALARPLAASGLAADRPVVATGPASAAAGRRAGLSVVAEAPLRDAGAMQAAVAAAAGGRPVPESVPPPFVQLGL